ncbi:MAG: hypothetical protein IJH45_01510 [Firmicutes bacterium]|nr:hypothetical protein [Bacillota bacterium]
MGLFNGFKNRHARYEEEIRELDRLNRDACYDLLSTKARGILIHWENSFRSFDRALSKRPPGCDEEMYVFYVTNCLEECCAFHDCHLVVPDSRLVELLIPLEEKLSAYINALAAQAGFHGGDQSDAIVYLAKRGQISFIVSFINDLEDALLRS